VDNHYGKAMLKAVNEQDVVIGRYLSNKDRLPSLLPMLPY
jgi:hypothetical protein